jgi:hypothetical protein
MGMRLDGPLYLQHNGYLTREKNRILDIGPQTIYHVRPEQIREFVDNQGRASDFANINAEIERLVYFSTPRPGERTTMLSEITDLTNIHYESIDVCPGLTNTTIMDLNFDVLPVHMREAYDVVLNFGTTEHIVNQWNCFKVIHDALKVGGVAYHQLPASGYLDHGYFCYTPLLFRELADANGYEIEQLAVTHAGESNIDQLGIRAIGGETLLAQTQHLGDNNRVPALNLHVLLRKTRSSDFRAPLEIATTHAPVDQRMLGRYGTGQQAPLATAHSELETAQRELDAIRNSRSWRFTQPLRDISAAAQHLLRLRFPVPPTSPRRTTRTRS